METIKTRRCALQSEVSWFFECIDKTPTCWIWKRAKRGKGNDSTLLYGRFTTRDENGKNILVSAHRYSWELKYGLVPEGLEIMHMCDNGLCVNPDHLNLGTHQDNMDDRNAKGRHAFGERNHSQLTEEQAKEIIAAPHNWQEQKKLGIKFKVNPRTIYKIQKGIKWSYLHDPH